MRKIRKNVFETNSSSVHSIVYSKEGMEPCKFKLNKDGKIEVRFGNFDKDERIYDTQYEKLSYLITCLWYVSGNTDDIYDNYQFHKNKRKPRPFRGGFANLALQYT